MGEPGRGCSKGLVELDVLGGVGKVILPADHMSDLHLDVIDHAYKVEYPRSIRTPEGDVGVGSRIGQVKFDASADLVLEDYLFPRRAEADRAVVLIKVATLFQAREILRVDGTALALVVGAVRAPLLWTLVPVESQPVKAIQDDLFGFLGVAGVIGVLDA